jgi:FtsP/CotA-like multicopper oxidase with cupredoxin domain
MRLFCIAVMNPVHSIGATSALASISPAVLTATTNPGQYVPFRSNRSITCRSRFIDFTGPYVMHCHILAHEDLGMMQGVTVT